MTQADHRATAALTLTSIGDLLAEPEETVDWLVEQRIPAGGVCVMAAKPKVGKSTAARDLALAVARGDSWLGHTCHAGMVWYFGFEGRRRDIRAHFRQMGACADDALRVFVGQAPRNVVTAVTKLAQHERPALIIVDTMQRFLRAQSTDDYAEMTLLFDAVLGIAQHSGATILLLHHSGKADRASLDAVLGSTAITGSADTIVLLARSERYRTIATVQRVGDDLPETVILLDEDTGRVRLGGSRAEADRELVASKLYDSLVAAGEPLTREEWLGLVEARRAVKLEAYRQVLAGNRIASIGAGTRNDPRRYFVEPADSGSRVPPNRWEPESTHSFFDDSPNKCDSYSGSQGSAQGPESAQAPEPAFVFDNDAFGKRKESA